MDVLERELERVLEARARRALWPRLRDTPGPSEPLRTGEDGRERELACEIGSLLRLTGSKAFWKAVVRAESRIMAEGRLRIREPSRSLYHCT